MVVDKSCGEILEEIKEIQENTKQNLQVINHNTTIVSTAIRGINNSLKIFANTQASMIKNMAFKDKILLVMVLVLAFIIGFNLDTILGLI